MPPVVGMTTLRTSSVRPSAPLAAPMAPTVVRSRRCAALSFLKATASLPAPFVSSMAPPTPVVSMIRLPPKFGLPVV